MCMIHLWIWTWYNDIEWSWIAYMLWILRNYVWIVILYPWLYLSSSKFLLILYGLWWCNANPQWFTTYLSVWTGRWSAGCLDFMLDVAEERSSSFYVQVSRLGLWSRIVLACWILFCLYSFGVEILIVSERCIYCHEILEMLFIWFYICSAAMFMKLDNLYMYVAFVLMT